MEITLTIPDEFAQRMIHEGQDPARQALEAMAVEGYRSHRLTGSQLRSLLGIHSRFEMDAFLKDRGVYLDYTIDDFRREGTLTAPLLVQQTTE